MTDNDWKARSISKTAENKKLKKRIKELTISRDSWKAKYIEFQKENEASQKRINSLKKKLKMIIEL